jgi:hypothetical protein
MSHSYQIILSVSRVYTPSCVYETQDGIYTRLVSHKHKTVYIRGLCLWDTSFYEERVLSNPSPGGKRDSVYECSEIVFKLYRK